MMSTSSLSRSYEKRSNSLSTPELSSSRASSRNGGPRVRRPASKVTGIGAQLEATTSHKAPKLPSQAAAVSSKKPTTTRSRDKSERTVSEPLPDIHSKATASSAKPVAGSSRAKGASAEYKGPSVRNRSSDSASSLPKTPTKKISRPGNVSLRLDTNIPSAQLRSSSGQSTHANPLSGTRPTQPALNAHITDDRFSS